MKIKILNKFNYQTFPITDDMVEFSEDELKEIGKTKCFENGKIIDYVMEKSPQAEIEELKHWFDVEYMRLEQKFRRLYTLNKTTDEGKNAYDELIILYQIAEQKRQRIQELEGLIGT